MIKSVELPNQVKLQYVEQGDPLGVPVLLLHGVTDSWHSFELVLPRLPTSIHAFALSQRGHGDADRPATGYGPHEFASDVAAFMDALKLGSSVIVGHSMSTSIAQRFALDHRRTRAHGLVRCRLAKRSSGGRALGLCRLEAVGSDRPGLCP